MSNALKLLLSTHHDLRSRHHTEIDAQLLELLERTEAAWVEIAQQERVWIAAEEEVMRKVFTLLQHDARPLLQTEEFARFLQRLAQQSIFEPLFTTDLPLTPADWLLNQLDSPARFESFVCTREGSDRRYRLLIGIGTWQHRLSGVSDSFQFPGDDADELRGFLEVRSRLQSVDFASLQLTPQQQQQLRGELSFVLCFFFYLFFPRPRVARFRYPASAPAES